MAKGDHSDLYMIFKPKGGDWIAGESRAELSSKDEVSKGLLKDFKKGCVFEIERFSLGAQADELSDEEIKAEIQKDMQRQKSQPAATPAGGKPGAVKGPVTDPNEEFHKRKAQQSGPPVREVTFSRIVDTTSKSFLGGLVAGQGYEKAALIKRKATGGTKTDTEDRVMAADVYIRIDFDPVLITKVDWSDDDEEVKENYSFITKHIKIQYRPQLPNGELGACIPGEWQFEKPK